jgi:hypothetical protein
MKLPKCSLFSAVVGALVLTAALAPNASATRELKYFNFEGNTFNSVPAPGPGGLYPFLQSPNTITNVSFPAGQLALAPGQGTTLNQLTGDAPTTNTALDAMGNDTAGSGPFCFQFTANTFTTDNIYTSLSLSFALNSVSGDTPHSTSFDTLQLFYSTGGGFTQIGGDIAINQNAGYYVITQPLPAGTLQQANLTLEFCFSGADNSAGGAHTYLDNIRLTATVVPEPSSYIGGLVGILGLCWFQRRWLVRSLSFRRA